MDIRRRESKTEASSREKRIYEKDQVSISQSPLLKLLCVFFFGVFTFILIGLWLETWV